MDKSIHLLIPTFAFALFILCPRMAAMTTLIHKNFPQCSIYVLVLGGALISIPFLFVLTWLVGKYGILAGLGFAILTDFLSALLLSFVSLKAGVETLIIAIFVVIGSKVASTLTAKLFP
ncbi:hypothetical protein SAMN04488516_10669 [Desulfonauticus submarinus]|uniref:Uncharacterized protein n=1 Tax=Desulfonauticus submarinus TaxID=206665 RepID=A0A1H0DZV9_9BACT|nr:hypothetical protein [Desulfonauticus submarinus]SDN75576.1 hypothetical protein SAMN04488516_10669 [Desulfonauticus submarinus]